LRGTFAVSIVLLAMGVVAAADEGAVATSHLVTLTNGMQIRCSLVAARDGSVEFAIGPFGTFVIPRKRIATIVPSEGRLELSPRPAPEPVAVAPPPPAEPAPPAEDRLTPPPVPLDKAPAVAEWLYALVRQRSQYRVRAERYLKAMGPYVVGPLLPYTEHSSWLVRCAALRILAHHGHPAGAAAMLRALADEHPVVRQVAHESLVALTGRRIAFDPEGQPARRRAAVAAWERHLRAEGLLPR
jgi:hypothetical protein